MPSPRDIVEQVEEVVSVTRSSVWRTWRVLHASAIIGEGFEGGEGAIELGEKRSEAFAAGKGVEERGVIPKCPFFFTVEPAPEFVAFRTVIHKDGAEIVQFICGRHNLGRGRRVPKMRDVGFLSGEPGRLGRLVSISAAVHDLCDRFAEFSFDVAQAFGAAGILHRIMQQRSDRFRFGGAIFHRDCRHAKDVRDIRDPGLLAELTAVNTSRIGQRLFKLSR